MNKMTNGQLVVRNASAADLDRVTELETRIFSAHSITPFDRGHFSAWLEVYPQGFFVAEQDGVVVGYTYTQVIDCDPNDPRELDRWTTFDVMNDKGYTKASHRAGGNYHLGVNIGSVVPGAGKALVEALVRLGDAMGKPLLGMSRVSGLKAYFEKLVADGIIGPRVDVKVKNAIALAYSLQCAKMVGGSVRLISNGPGMDYPDLPALPAVAVPDPVLCKYLRNPHFAVWALLPAFIKDPASLDYAVLMGPAK